MKNENPLEKVIEKAICEHAKKLGVLVYKFVSPNRRSVPDRLMVSPSGVVFFMELKRRGEVPTAAQHLEIEKIRKTGVKVFVVDTIADGKRIVDEIVKSGAM